MLYAEVVKEKKHITMKLTIFFSEVITKCFPYLECSYELPAA